MNIRGYTLPYIFFRIWHCILLQIGSTLLNVLADIALCSTTMVAFSDSVYIA